MEKLSFSDNWDFGTYTDHIQSNFLINFIMSEKVVLKMTHYEFDLNKQIELHKLDRNLNKSKNKQDGVD